MASQRMQTKTHTPRNRPGGPVRAGSCPVPDSSLHSLSTYPPPGLCPCISSCRGPVLSVITSSLCLAGSCSSLRARLEPHLLRKTCLLATILLCISQLFSFIEWSHPEIISYLLTFWLSFSPKCTHPEGRNHILPGCLVSAVFCQGHRSVVNTCRMNGSLHVAPGKPINPLTFLCTQKV